MITLCFEGFSGTPKELAERVRRGQIEARDLPVLVLTEQALAQVTDLGLSERSELLPTLVELLLYKLRAFAPRPEPEPPLPEEEAFEGGLPGFLETLVLLEEAIGFLEQRARERARVLPVPPSPLPKDRRVRPLPVGLLLEAARPLARRVELRLEPETFGLKEAWERLLRFLQGVGRALFGRLPFLGWGEQTVAFAALLEAKKQGRVELRQAENFGPLEVELREGP